MLAKVGLGLGAVALIFSIYNTVQVNATNAKLEEEISNMNLKIQTGSASTTSTTVPNGTTNNQGVSAITLDQQNMNMGTNPQTNPTSMVPSGPTTSIKFTKDLHSFGTVQEESENMYSFTFTNTGKEPLVIQDAKGSCGCTVPNYPKQPIMPGKTGTIDVKFTPYKGQIGPAEKTVTVTANTEPSSTIIKIQANVVEKK